MTTYLYGTSSTDDSMLESHLNEMGQDGWELVTYYTPSNPWSAKKVNLIWRRPKETQG